MTRSIGIAALAATTVALAACAGVNPPTLEGSAASSSGALPPPVAATPAPATGNQSAAASTPAIVTTKQGGPANEVATTIAPGARGDVIASAKGASVVLYASPDGADGQRVPSSALGFPISTSSRTQSGRYEVMTVDGPRWIAAAEVTMANQVPATSKR